MHDPKRLAELAVDYKTASEALHNAKVEKDAAEEALEAAGIAYQKAGNRHGAAKMALTDYAAGRQPDPPRVATTAQVSMPPDAVRQ